MAIEVTTASPTKIISIEEAKRHLRVYDGSHDDEIRSLIDAAIDDCERFCQRTFRIEVEREWKMDSWWTGTLQLPYPPHPNDGDFIDVHYFDDEGSEQDLSSANYWIEYQTDGPALISWVEDIELPDLDVRPDAVTVTFVSGYQSPGDVPPSVIQAIKTKLTEMWGAGTDKEIEAAMKAADRLLGKHDSTSYA